MIQTITAGHCRTATSSEPRFSVIVTGGDQQRLARTADNWAAQEFPGSELLVVAPSCPDVVQGRPDVQWVDGAPLTPVQGVNAGLRLARGRFVSWLEAGEKYYDDALCEVADFLAERPALDVVYGDANTVDDDGEPFGRLRAKDWKPSRLRRRCFLARPAVFVRRTVLQQSGGFDEQLRYWADYECWLRLCAQGARFARLPSLLADWRVESDDRTEQPRRECRLAAVVELNNVLAKKFGCLSSKQTLLYGQAMAQGAGLTRESSRRYDRFVLGAALRAGRRWNRDPWSTSISLPALLAQHLKWEVKRIWNEPEEASRFAPPWRAVRAVGRLYDAHLRRKVFRLTHHDPHALTTPPHYLATPVPPNPPRISIVTPNYNGAEFLGATLASVLDQKYPALQYIVQDGGSTDGSVETIQRHASQLALWESGPDGGQTAALNRGMRRADGEILAYLNSDDLLLPGALAYVASFFSAHPEIDVVYGHRVLIDEQGREIGRWVLPQHDESVIAWADYIPQETMFWRRRAWDAIGRAFDEQFKFAMDWDLILRFHRAGMRFARLPRFLGAFRVASGTKTTRLLATVGRREIDRLRRRELGTTPTGRQMRRALRGYYWRHWWLDKCYQLGLAKY